MRKSRKSDYIILALACLIILNIGSALIGYYSSNREERSLEQNGLKLTSIPMDYIKRTFPMDKILIKTINSLFPMAEGLEYREFETNKEIVVASYEEMPEEDHDTELNIIIRNLEEYESLIIVKDNEGIHTVENVPEPFMLKNIKVDRERPYILMYHTHATEAYLQSRGDNYRSSVKDYNVVGMGDLISTVLEANNHKVDHVEIYHDLPSYNQSYSRSLNTIRKKQEENDNLLILLDIHRDGIEDDSPNIETLKVKEKIEINGKTVAKFSLVVGPDSDNTEEVLLFAKYIKAVSDALYPGLCSGIIIKPVGRYNQYLSNYSTLIELGYHFHTIEEAKESAKLVGEVLSIVFNSIIEE